MIVDAARALLYDSITTLSDLARRSPPMFAVRVRLLITELEDTAQDLEHWDTIAARYAYPTARTPPDR